MMTPEADELAELRRRAYGPEADIGTDPVARRRLRELEGRLRAVVKENSRSGAPTARSPQSEPADVFLRPPAVTAVDAVLIGAPREIPAAATGAATAAQADPTASVGQQPVGGVRIQRGLIGLAAATGVLLVVGSFWLGRSTGERQPDELFSENLAEPPAEVGRVPTDDDLHYGITPDAQRWQGRVADGLEIWTAETAEGNRCLTVTFDAEDRSGGGYRVIYGMSCAHTLDPSVEIQAGALPEPDHPDFADVQMLRFVWRSDGVAMFLDPAPPEPS